MVMHPSQYRWVIVAAGGLLGCVAIGAMFALPVFLRPIAEQTGWSITGISGAMTFGFLAMAVGSLFWGDLSDRIGPRPVVLLGTVLLIIALAWSSRVQTLLSFQLIFGGLVGLGAAAIFAPMMACVTGWFDTQRSLAVSLVSAGMGMAPMTMSPFAAWLIARHDWRTALLLIAGLVAVLMLPAALFVRRPPASTADIGAPDSRTVHAGPEPSRAEVLRSSRFAILVLTNFFCCATHSGPIFHTVSYAVTCGIPLMAAVSIYSLEGLAGLGGRVVFGLLGDRYGARRMLVAGLLAQAFAALAYLPVRHLGSFYAVAALFGFLYAGVMPLYAVIARENFPPSMMGVVIGATAMAGSLGMAAGPVIGGLIYDHSSSYAGLFVGAFAVGIAAVLMALRFRPIASGTQSNAAGVAV